MTGIEGFQTEVLEIKSVMGSSQSVTFSLKDSKGNGQVAFSVTPKGARVTINGEEALWAKTHVDDAGLAEADLGYRAHLGTGCMGRVWGS